MRIGDPLIVELLKEAPCRLDRHVAVEISSWLVGEEKGGLRHERPRDCRRAAAARRSAHSAE